MCCRENEARAVFPLSFLSVNVMMSQRKVDTVGTWLTIRKRAKRMPDILVETTQPRKLCFKWFQFFAVLCLFVGSVELTFI